MKLIYFFKKATSIFSFKTLALACSVLVLHGCMKDEFKNITMSGWQPEFATALVNTKFELKDFLKGDNASVIKEDPNTHFLTIVYNNSPFAQDANEMMKLDSLVASISKGLPAGMPISGGTWPFDITMTDSTQEVTSFKNEDNVEVDSIRISSGQLEIEVKSDFKFAGKVTMVLTSLKDDQGATRRFEVKFTPGVSSKQTFDISKMGLDMSMGGTASNTVPMKYIIEAELKNGTTFDNSQKIAINLTLKNIKFGYVNGYFGSIPMDLSDALPLGLFNNSITGTIKLQDPKIKLKVSSSFGLPVNVSFDTLMAKPSAGGPPVYVKMDTLKIPASPSPGVYDSASVSPKPSEISDMIACSPSEIKYKVSVKTNPNGKVAGKKNFISATSKVKLDFDLELPLWGSIKDMTILDTSNFSLEKETIEKMEDMSFRITTDNGLPADIKLQVYFVDSSFTPYKKLDSLITDGQSILVGAIVDENPGPNLGKVLSSSKKTTTVVLSNDRLQKIRTVNKLMIKGVMNTSSISNSVPVRIAANNYLGLKLASRIKLKVN